MFSVENLLALINGLGGIVWEAEPETFRFTFVSQQAEDILGYPVRQWLEPDFWRRHTHPDDVAESAAFCLDATREGRDHVFEYRMIGADGRIVWLRDIVSVRRSADGEVRLFGVALDITAEKQEEAERRRLARLREALFENSSDNIALFRSDGTTVFQSSAIRHQLGYEPDELVGSNNFRVVHPDDLRGMRERFAETLQGEGVIGPVRFRARHKNGSWRVLETVGKRFTDENGETFVVANSRDVTDVVEAQQALQSTQEQLAHATKMEAVGRLAGGIAHDFNNLLTIVAGYADLLASTFEASDPRAADVDEIRRAAHRAGLLTKQLLTFSRKQPVRLDIVDLGAVLRDVSLLIRRLTGDEVELVIEATHEPLPVLADRSQLEQVIMNLVVNARDAIPDRGSLSVRTRREQGTALLEVSDSGTGMTSEVIERIFEPFFTTKEIGKGTGLGLAIVYGIVKQCEGHIQVESEVGEGTTFTISLPLAQDPEERETAQSQDTPERA